MKKLRLCVRVLGLLMFSLPLIGYDNSPNWRIFLPEAIWAPATGGGTWITEIQITDLSGGAQVRAVFYPGNSGGSQRNIWSLWTSPGIFNCVNFSNILATFQARDSSYAYYGKVGSILFLTQDEAHKIQVSARTVNGNYGKTFPGLNYNVDSNCANVGRPMIIQDLRQNATYRTFVGCFNAQIDYYSMTVEFGLYGSDGNRIGNLFNKTLGPYEFISFNPFAEAGVPSGSYNSVFLVINPKSSGNPAWGLISFASSANNYTNDTSAHIAVQFH